METYFRNSLPDLPEHLACQVNGVLSTALTFYLFTKMLLVSL